MKKFAVVAAFVAAVCASSLIALQDAHDFPEMPAPQKEHEWLQKFVGEWTMEAEMMMGPEETFRCTGTEKVRSLGGRWIVSDFRSESPMGPMVAAMTIGYDPAKGKYIGTWVDSMTNHMWVYEGTVDASGKVLTLNSTGPNMMDPTPGATANYRDVVEWKDENTRVLTSMAQDANGEWLTFGTMTFRRK